MTIRNSIEKLFDSTTHYGETSEIRVVHTTPDGKPCDGMWTIAFASWGDAQKTLKINTVIGGGCKKCGKGGSINSKMELVM